MEIDSWYELKIENDRLNSKKIIKKKRNKNAIKSLRILYFGKCLDCVEGGVVSIDGMR